MQSEFRALDGTGAGYDNSPEPQAQLHVSRIWMYALRMRRNEVDFLNKF
jgi:hypothetical protein